MGFEGAVATSDSGHLQSAVCAEYPMIDGTHYAEMTLLKKGSLGGGVYMGVVGAGFDAASGRFASSSTDSWLFHTGGGRLLHAGSYSSWQGQPQPRVVQKGDVVGLLLDLGQRTLSVYLNSARLGVMVAPGMVGWDELSGPLRWVADVGYGSSVRIAAAHPPL